MEAQCARSPVAAATAVAAPVERGPVANLCTHMHVEQHAPISMVMRLLSDAGLLSACSCGAVAPCCLGSLALLLHIKT
jgi:hypothetical protein